MAGYITVLSSQVTGQSGSKYVGSLTINAANQILQVDDFTFNSAQYIAITPPVLATIAVICPPSANLVSLTLKGVTGDTGIAISPFQASIITFPAGSSSNFGLLSGGAITGVVEISYM